MASRRTDRAESGQATTRASLRRAARRLRRAAVKRQTIAAMPAEMVAIISHEMREPLNGILGMTRLLRETALNSDQTAYVTAVLESAEALVGLVNDILALARIEAQGLQLQPTSFALRPFLDRLIASLVPRARQKGLTLRLDLAADLPELVRGDPARLRQVLLNLLGNALKFTDVGEVRLAASRYVADAGDLPVRITVSDTGPGIPEAALATLFRPFAQADETQDRLYGGSGLGLVIARRIVEAMGGQLVCRSEVGVGTTFELSIAFQRPSADASQIAGPAASLAGASVLIVDPDAVARTRLSDLVGLWGMDARGAKSCGEAMALLHEAGDRGRSFDIVLIDSRLTDRSPADLALTIRGEPKLAHARLVLLAEGGLRGDAARAQDAGFNAYLSKPVTPTTLQNCLRRLRSHVADHEVLTVHSLSEQRGASLSILVVDDLPLNCRLVTVLLQRAGHEVTSVHSGAEALDLLAERMFDVVLLDLQMPGMDGLETARRVRALPNPARAAVPIVAVTADALRGQDQRCRAVGMNDYLTKPIDGASLVGAVERWGRQPRHAA